MATEHEYWTRVRERLRVEVGDNVYSSWFARMDLEGIEGETVKLSVPTRFLKSWIASHYTEKVMSCWQAEQPGISRVEITVRSAMVRPVTAKAVPAQNPAPMREAPTRLNGAEVRIGAAPISAVHEALGGSPLDPRLTFDSFVVGRSNTLAHAAAKQVAAGAPRRQRDVQPALHPCRRRAGQDASAAGAGLGRQRRVERKVLYLTAETFHVRLRRCAARADGDRLQGGAARPSTCW